MTVDEHSREITRSPTTFHWGRYEVVTSGGEIVALQPDPPDPHPSASPFADAPPPSPVPPPPSAA
ncbi:hypothetical protein ACZ91_27550, partial [Streptomyces regensis]